MYNYVYQQLKKHNDSAICLRTPRTLLTKISFRFVSDRLQLFLINIDKSEKKDMHT